MAITRREAIRTIVMLANRLAKADESVQLSQTELQLSRALVNELSAANHDKELELQEYRREEENRRTADATATEATTGVMSFGQAVELMARRPGLELVDNEGDLWRVTGTELQGALGGRANPLWVPRGISNEWNLLTFRIGTIQSVLTAQ